jgi:hypothetical protein
MNCFILLNTETSPQLFLYKRNLNKGNKPFLKGSVYKRSISWDKIMKDMSVSE